MGAGDGWHNLSTPAGSHRKYFNYPSSVVSDSLYLYVADRTNQRVSRWRKSDGQFKGWIGGGRTEWTTDTDGPALEPVGSSSGYVYPPTFMLQPSHLALLSGSLLGGTHNYLFLTTVYNQRVSRWNLDCVDNNFSSAACTGD